MIVQSTAVDLVVHDLTLSIVSARIGTRRNSRNETSVLPAHFESNSPRRCIQSENEIAVASDAFNGTFSSSAPVTYEHALSFLFSFDHDRRLLVDNCPGAKRVRHGESVRWRTGHDPTIAFSDHK